MIAPIEASKELVASGGTRGVQVVVGISVGMVKVGVLVAGSGLGVAVGSEAEFKQPASSGKRNVAVSRRLAAEIRMLGVRIDFPRNGLRRADISALTARKHRQVNQARILP